MKIVIIEDEVLAARRLQKLIADIDDSIQVLSVLDSVEGAVNWMQHNSQPDLFLMDIELADGQSFEIFSLFEFSTPVIFTTAYDEFALKAFKVNSIDYLLKPVKQEELALAIQKFKKQQNQFGTDKLKEVMIQMLASQQEGVFKERFLVKNGQRLLSVQAKDVACFFSEEKISFLKTSKGQKFALNTSLDELEKQIDPKIFFRANRQFIVHEKSILEISSWFNGKLKLKILMCDEEVIVSRERAPILRKWLGD